MAKMIDVFRGARDKTQQVVFGVPGIKCKERKIGAKIGARDKEQGNKNWCQG